MEDILGKIIRHKKQEVALKKMYIEESTMCSAAENAAYNTISMRHALEQSPIGIIAEFKRKSPSKGWINRNADLTKIVQGYCISGASACSVLTDSEFFGGSIDDLVLARRVVSEDSSTQIPLLRKEFIIDPYQIYEARMAGADAILLIASCLSKVQCEELASVAHSLSLEVLLEIHSEEELMHLNPNIDMLGVNNRNLGTFHTDIQNSFQLSNAIEANSVTMISKPLLVSESGISEPNIILELRKAGFRGFLMGETFMKTTNPAHELSNLIGKLQCK